jgi:hypothetical protein
MKTVQLSTNEFTAQINMDIMILGDDATFDYAATADFNLSARGVKINTISVVSNIQPLSHDILIGNTIRNNHSLALPFNNNQPSNLVIGGVGNATTTIYLDDKKINPINMFIPSNTTLRLIANIVLETPLIGGDDCTLHVSFNINYTTQL